MKCIFKHNWIYSEKRLAQSEGGNRAYVYDKRECRKCGKIQENNGYFETSFNMKNNWENRWVTIGYSSPKE